MSEHVFVRVNKKPHSTHLYCSCGWVWWGSPSSEEEIDRYMAEHQAAAREAERQEEAEHGPGER